MLLILLSLFLNVPTSVKAQESLFPEFSGLVNEEQQAVLPENELKEIEEVFSEDLEEEIEDKDSKTKENIDLFEEKKEQVIEVVPEIPEKDEETDEDKKQKILIGVTNVNSTLTPNRNMSFCSVIFGIENKTKKELSNISGSFTIGTYTKKFQFIKVPKGDKKSEDFFIVGESCEQVLATPTIEITTCQVPDWSDKKCRSKIEIVPITTE